MPNGSTKTNTASNNLNITANIHIDTIELTAAKAYDVSLIESKKQWYVSIRKQYKKKTSVEWENGKAMWIPFDAAEQINRIIQKACEEGNRRHLKAVAAHPTPTAAVSSSIDVEKELLEVKAKLENLENHIHNMEANKEQKAHLKLIERILKALS